MLRAMLVTAIALIAFPAAAASLTIDAKNTRQVIRGFGTCLISWGTFPSTYDDEMARVYVDELGLNILRVSMAAWGYPEVPATEMTADKIDLGNRVRQVPRAARPRIGLDQLRARQLAQDA